MVRRQAGSIAIGILGVLLFWFACIQMAYATPPENRPPDNRPPDRGQEVSTQASAEAAAESRSRADASSESVSTSTSSATGGDSSASATGGAGGAGGDAHATNEGVTVSNEGDSYSSESTNTNVVLVPNNNTSDCNRVYGISFGNGGGAGALGVPFRDKACDYEQAADDAAATGQHDIAWYWRCHKPNLYRTFDGSDRDAKIRSCHSQMRSLLVEEEPVANFNEPQPVMVAAADEFDAQHLMAQLSEEELEQLKEELERQDEEHDQVLRRQAQQQSVIESQREQLDRLRQEAEELRRAEEKRRAEEEAARAKFAERLKAKEQPK